ncbi:hypothetical protein D3C73_1302680 [compost metagenome]
MRGDLLAFRIKPFGHRQIDGLGAVEQPRLVVNFGILDVRAVLLEVIGKLLLGAVRKAAIRVQLDVSGVQIQRNGLHIVFRERLVIILHIGIGIADIAGTACTHDIAAVCHT